MKNMLRIGTVALGVLSFAAVSFAQTTPDTTRAENAPDSSLNKPMEGSRGMTTGSGVSGGGMTTGSGWSGSANDPNANVNAGTPSKPCTPDQRNSDRC